MFISSNKKQTGFTLIMSLMILVILTMLGLTSTQSTRTEVAMAGNMRESDMAFQVAEIGVRSAEIFTTGSARNQYNDIAGLYAANTNDPDYFEDASWEGVQTSTAVIENVYTQPQFIIKYLGDRSQDEVASVNIGGYGTAQPGITVSNFRCTAKGGGKTDSATRIIQTYFGRTGF